MWGLLEILMKALRVVSDFTVKNKIGKFEKVFSILYCFCYLLIFILNNLFAYHLLTYLPPTFIRCGSKQGEEDYRPLFENFVQDLLSTVNKPEWPAAELLLSLLGRLLVSVESLLN